MPEQNLETEVEVEQSRKKKKINDFEAMGTTYAKTEHKKAPRNVCVWWVSVITCPVGTRR